jgi:hypothetical protein
MTELSRDLESRFPMVRVVVESPLGAPDRAGIEDNKTYARACVRDCLERGEAPYASHLFYDQPGVLNDLDPNERNMGMLAGMQWGAQAHKVVVYLDRGLSAGMQAGIDYYRHRGIPIEERYLYGRENVQAR